MRRPRSYAIKAPIADRDVAACAFAAAKTMYGGKHILPGDTVFLFASETSGGQGLIARGMVLFAEPIAPLPGIARQTPRVSVSVDHIVPAIVRLGRAELTTVVSGGSNGGAQAEIHFKLYRQVTDKIVGITDETARFIDRLF